MAERFPQDFCGAAPRRIELIYLSSDEEEELDNLSVTSVMDLQLTSDDEEYDDEIMMMAQCVEMELSAPIPVPGPSSSRLDCVNMRDNLARNKTFDQKHSPRLFLSSPSSHWEEEMDQYDVMTECVITTR